MKKLFLLLPFFLLTTMSSFAQPGANAAMPHAMYHEASTLSVFSENGDQFFLVLNGISQNNVPVSKIRIEGLPQFGNDIQILFADRSTPEISKRLNITDPVDGKEVNMTLKIIRDREGNARLRFHKCVEVDHQYKPEQDEYVMNYGQQQAQPATVNYPQQQQPAPGNYAHQQNLPQRAATPAAMMAMDPQSFNDAKQSITNASFEDTKLSTAKNIFSANYISTGQVMEVCRLFSFEDSKVTFAKFAYSRTVDPNNYYQVANVFDFDSNKQALNDFISNGGR